MKYFKEISVNLGSLYHDTVQIRVTVLTLFLFNLYLFYGKTTSRIKYAIENFIKIKII